MQHRLVAHALHERQRLAVGRGLRPHRAAGAGHHVFDLARLAVQATDRVDHVVHVAVVFEAAARAHVLGEVDEAAVGRQRRLALVLLVVLALGQLQAGAAVAVVEPELAGAQRALRREVLAAHQVLAVGRPGAVVEQAEIFLADLHRAAAVGLHAPEVVAAAAVGGERDFLAVRREPRLDVPRRAAGDAPRAAAAGGQRVQVAQHREDDRLAVRAQVEVEPGAFIGAEAHRLALGVSGIHVPLGFRGACGGRADAESKANRERQRATGRHGQLHSGDRPMLGASDRARRRPKVMVG